MISAAAALELWERGSAATTLERGCMLAACVPAADSLPAAAPVLERASTLEPIAAAPVDVARLPIGVRNRTLLELWQKTFGEQIACRVDCPACGSELGVDLHVADLLGPGEFRDPLRVEVDGYKLEFRRLTTEDLLEVQTAPSVAEARQQLIDRCVVHVSAAEPRVPGAESSVASAHARELPPEVVAGLADALETADPLVDLRLRLTCAECGHAWSPFCDLASLAWAELEALALRTLDEVHTLAEHYAWRESDVLAMSPARRAAYLARIGGLA